MTSEQMMEAIEKALAPIKNGEAEVLNVTMENETTEEPGVGGWANVALTGKKTLTIEFKKK